MKKQFQSKSVPRGTRTIWRYLGALFILFTFGIGNVWAEELCSATLNGISSNSNTTGIAQTGCTMKWNSVNSGSDVVTIGSVSYYKFSGSSSYVQLVLSSGKFKAGDELTVTLCSNAGSGKTKSVQYSLHSDSGNKSEAQDVGSAAPSNVSYTLVAADIESDGSIKIFRGGNTNIRFGSFSVVRPAECTETAPTSVAVSGGATYDKGDALSNLSAVVTGGTGTMSYQWYRNTTNAATISDDLKLANCTTATLTPANKVGTYYYYCVASNCAGSVTSGTTAVTINPVCPSSGTIYKFQVKTGLTSGNLVTSVPKDVDMTTDNYLSALVGGELMAAARANVNRINITGGNAIGFANGADAYLEMTLDCAIQAGDIIKYTVASNNMLVRLTSASTEENQLTLDRTKTQVEVPAAFVGATKLYMIRASSSPNISYFEVVRPVYRTITLEYADGATPDGSIKVLDGEAATKPADPTWAHHRFDGWYDGSDPYDWSETVGGDLTLTAHWTQLYTITYAAGDGTATGDAPTQVDKAAGEKFNVAANTFAVAGKDFVKWNDGTSDYNPGQEYTMGSANVTLTAQWKAASSKYTVIFKDGETELGTKLFEVGSNPSDAEIDKTKPMFTFAAWQKDEADIALDDAFWATVVKDATVTLTARWAKAYAANIDFEAFIDANGTSGDWGAELADKHYAISSTAGVTLDAPNGKPADKGLKIKNSGSYLSFNVHAGKLVLLKAGVLSGAEASVDGGAHYATLTGATGSTAASVVTPLYNASEAEYRIRTTTGSYNIIQSITIQDPYQVTFNANGGEDVASLNGTPSVMLPLPVKGTDSFLGWFIGEDKIGEAGDSYTPTANVELVAHWEAISTDARLASITFSSDAGTLSPAFDPEVTSYTYTMPYGTAAIPTITGGTAYHAQGSVGYIVQAENWGDVAEIRGIAASADTKKYQITMLQEPKDGVSIIKVATTGGTNKTVTGVYAGDGDVSLSSSKKMDNGKYIGFTLDGTTLQAGDRINVHTTQAANTGGSHIIFYDNMTDKNELYDTEEIGGTGDNIFTINAAMVGSATAYVYRANNDAAHQWNGYVDYIEVTRAMDPVLTAITIDGRDGEIDALDDKHFSVQIPYESNLAALTVVPTIIRNAAHATTPEAVVSNAGAWILGDNTYRIMDKDGDYTDYTITLDRDVLKHTVSFNTHGGSAVASELVVDGESLEAAPAAPEKEDYLFQGWAETDGGAIVDVTTFAISADKEFHAVWASDGAIKLIEAGAINHTNFITGATMSESPVSIATVDYDYAKLGSTASNPSVNALNKLIAYNATTTKTKVMIDVYNKNTSARTVKIWGVVEGSSEYEELASIALDNGDNKRVKSAYYEFNNLDGKNRTIYIGVPSSVGDVAFLQVKVVESGDPIHMFGEVGYSINFNKGRLFGPSATDLAFEGMTYKLSSGYQALSSTAISLNKNSSYRVDVASPVTMTVTTSNGSKFYVDQATDGTANETASAGAHEFDLTAGTWYINVAGSNLSVSSISFAQPKAAKPVVAAMDDVEYCQGSAIDALTVSATVSDGGTMLYQWYKDGDAISGAEAATYQPTVDDADGEYYVVVVNTKDGYQNSDAVQSDTITVTGYAGTAISGTTGAEDWPDAHVTISVTASGKNLSYAWYTCDDAMGTNPVAVEPAVNADELDVTVGAADTYYKVVVSGDCGSAQEAVITVVARQAVELQDVTGDMSWNFSKANDGSAATENLCNDEVLANVHGINNNDDFKSAYLKATANKFKSGKLQASMIKFHTTVDGMITVVFSNTGSKSSDRYLTVNGRKTDKGSKNETAVTYTGFVYAGDVVLGVVEGDGNMLNFTSVQFTATTSYTRPVNPSFLGTLCWTNDAVLGGGTLYEFAGKDEHNYLAFDEVEENRLEAGKPYIFMPENGNTEIKVYNIDDAEPLTTNQAHVNHMYGTIVDTDLYPTTDVNMYYFSSNHIWAVKDFTVEKITIPAYYCYVDYPAVLAGEPAAAPAQGRRRVTMGVNGQNTTTGIGEIEASETPMKVMINGQIFIIRGEKMYDVTGKLVK